MSTHSTFRTYYHLVALIFLLVLFPIGAQGRVGGGGRYSSGSSSSGGSYSSGGGSYGTSYGSSYRSDSPYESHHTKGEQISMWVSIGGLVLFLVICGIIGLVKRDLKSVAEQKVELAISDHQRRQLEQRLSTAIAKIKERDPKFDLDRLRKRLSHTFETLQKAWSDNDMGSVRHEGS